MPKEKSLQATYNSKNTMSMGSGLMIAHSSHPPLPISASRVHSLGARMGRQFCTQDCLARVSAEAAPSRVFSMHVRQLCCLPPRETHPMATVGVSRADESNRVCPWGGHCTLYSSLPVRLGDGSHQGTVYSQEQIRDHLRIPPPHPPRTLRTNVNQDSETSVCCQAHSVGPHRLAARRIGSLSRCTWRGSGGASICTAVLQMGNQVTLE